MAKTEKSLEILRSMKEIMSQLRQYTTASFKDLGITAPQGYLLGMLSRTGKMKVHELGEKLGMTDSTVSGVVDRLEKLGMVDRTRSKEDKRVVFVEITEKFNKAHGDFHSRMDESVSRTLGTGTPKELEKITEGLEIMKKLLKNNGNNKREKA